MQQQQNTNKAITTAAKSLTGLGGSHL
jgi:hypothetical protein